MKKFACFASLFFVLASVSSLRDGFAAPTRARHHRVSHQHVKKTRNTESHQRSARHHRKTAPRTAHRRVAQHPPVASRAATIVGSNGGRAAATAGAAIRASQDPARQAEMAPLPPIVEKGSQTGLPLPRFAALRADRVYMRRGPGQRYPIEWVYRRRGLPIQIDREFDVWRLVEDSDGVKGWVHQATLVGRRDVVVIDPTSKRPMQLSTTPPSTDTKEPVKADTRIVAYLPKDASPLDVAEDAVMRREARDDSVIVAFLRPGTVGRLMLCKAQLSWCQISVKGYSGWILRRSIWGLSPNEEFIPS